MRTQAKVKVVYTATASDTDFNGAEDITFSLADDSLGFSIDAATGVVTTNTDFESNFEDAQSQSFTVVATDAAGNASEQVVSVAINNLDEVAPSITSGDTGTAVNENSGADQVVYTATASDTDFNGAEDITFSLADDSLGFSIDVSTGVVTTNTDFESNFEDAQSQSFTVVATDAAGNASEQVVSVAINNLDEVAPSITSGDTGTAVNENSGADQVVYTATASDTDFNGAEDITFSLADESLGFSIDEDAGVVTTNADFAVDYENTQSQSFTVVATDAAGNASEQVVSVAINNLDEVAPSITSGDTATAINENLGAGQVVYTATATDDADTSGGVTFSLTGDSDPALSIDPSTGAVTLSANPDFEAQSQYSFTVVATDAAGNASDAKSVKLDINNLDEIAPTITSGDTASTIDENSGSGQVVYTATATDDADTSGGVTFSLTGDSDPALSIDSLTGAVTLATNPEYETQNQYSFTVVADDGVNEAVEQLVTLDINNLDDTAPVITSSDSVFVDENIGEDGVVYTVTTDDAGPVTYELISVLRIQEGAIDQRYINNGDGSITLQLFVDESVALDYIGELNNYDLTITYNSHEITDPQISFPDATLYDETNEAVLGEIVTATIIMPGLVVGEDALLELTYQLEEGYVSAEFGVINLSLGQDLDLPDSIARYYGSEGFSIDANTGVVTINDNPDYETQVSYRFSVAATDVAGNQSEVITVDLGINDIDDAAPTITSGDTADAIDENLSAGQVVYTASADDSGDDVVVGPITFSLAEGSDPALSINAETGVVTITTSPDYEAQSAYNFAVIATDGAGNASEAQSVTLDINNLDEVAATITSATTAAVDENIGENQVIYTVTSDDTADISQGVTYSLGAASDPALSINADTGEVSLSTDPDYETQSEYQFTVFATDAAGNRSAEQEVTLSINDLDDSSVTGKVYHWGTQTMLDNVSISLHNQTNGEMMSSATTDGSGIYSMTDLAAGDITLTVERDTQGVNDSQEITHEDVVAALKMAVGLNPNAIVNGHQNAVTPYQFIAADINKDGRITSFDALSILRMSLNEPDAIEQEWMFVTESADFWNEYAVDVDDVFNIDKSSVNWDSDPTAMTLTHPDEMNFVGVLLGDVDNSWSAPEDAVAMPDGYFDLLEDDGIAPLEQWGLTDQFVYTGTDNGDDFGLSDVDTVITSGAGEDQFILDSVSASATHTITDFESGVDTIQMGKIMVSAGYTIEDAPTQLASADMSADILDLVNGDDSSLDNLFGATYDEDSNTLTVFADNDSSVGATDMNSIQITLDENATVEDEDIVANLSPFIA
jgi:hypothetical protein